VILFKSIVSVMCGIVGYIGNREAQPILLNCLSKLEYRGYDSCGIAVCDKNIRGYKDAGRVYSLKNNSPRFHGNMGIGHTRWATHGLPNKINAHPHYDCSGKTAVVHNGIISNYQQLKHKLINEGHNFLSETDTEVIPHLVEKFYQGNLVKAVEYALSEIEGTFAIMVMREGHEELVVSRRDSPLVIGIGDGENFIASDVPAMLEYTNRIIYLEDGDIVRVSRKDIGVIRNSIVVDKPEIQQISWDAKEVGKNGYEHFMIKEIREQARVIRDSLIEYTLDNTGRNSYISFDSNLRDLLIVACGTSYHAGLIGKYIIEEILGIPVRVELGSEFNHRNRIIVPSITIGITQSGETADVLIPLKKLRNLQAKTMVITNVLGSTASRLTDRVIYTSAGPEVSVAATKTFMAQLIELYKIVYSSPLLTNKAREQAIEEMKRLPSKVQKILDNDKQFENCANFLSEYGSALYIGRGINFPVALEGALKLKEISYIHAEGYAAGELKHGPFALLDKDTPVVAIVAQGDTYSSMINNIKEIKARQSPVIALADESDEGIETVADIVIRLPHVPYIFSPIINTIAIQLIAYYTAKHRGCPVDYPKNLAKSVTVE
jgi:glutamine---fructose-6-phosphate transaminase (isomerizing)